MPRKNKIYKVRMLHTIPYSSTRNTTDLFGLGGLREISTPILSRGSTRLSVLVDETSLGDGKGSNLSSSVDDDETNNS